MFTVDVGSKEASSFLLLDGRVESIEYDLENDLIMRMIGSAAKGGGPAGG
jgi:hypothetical protein